MIQSCPKYSFLGVFGGFSRMDHPTTSAQVRRATFGPHCDVPTGVSLRFGQTAWDVDSDVIDELFDDDGLRLDEWRRNGCTEVVKTGRHRTVYRLNLPSGRFYLKHYKIADWQALLRNLLRPCPALDEWNAAQKVADVGIPTFQPVAVGCTFAGLLVCDSFLISRAIENVEGLDQLMRGSTPGRPVSRQTIPRQRLAVQLGRLTARLHSAGLFHRDLHAANIPVRVDCDEEVRLWLVDLHAMSIGRRPTMRRIAQNVSLLNNDSFEQAAPADRLRFFRAYWEALRGPAERVKGNGSSKAFSQAVRHVEAHCRRAMFRAHRKGDRKWARGNRQLIIADSPAARCRGVAELCQRRLEEVRDRPEQLFAAENIRYWCQPSQTGRTAAVRVDLGGESTDCFVKVIDTPPFTDVWWPPHRDSIARRAWEVGHALLRRGIGTPRPLLFVELRAGPQCKQYLLTEQIPGAVPFSVFVNVTLGRLRPARRESWLSRYANQLAIEFERLHRCGFDHHRPTGDHLLVSQDPADCRVWFLGLTALEQRYRLSRTRRLEGLARLNASFASSRWVRNTHRVRFLKRYLGSRFKREWKLIWRRIMKNQQHDRTTQTCVAGRISRRLFLLAGLHAAVGACGGCQAVRQKVVALPKRHSVSSDQLLVLSDFKLRGDHPLIEDLKRLRSQVASTLDLPFHRERVVVYLFGSELAYRQYLAVTYPQLPPRRAYFVGTPEKLAVYTFWGDRIQEDLRHEFTHGLLHSCHKHVPLWLDEGLAEYFEVAGPSPGGVNSDYVERLTNKMANGWRPDIKRLESLDEFSQMQRTDYQEAWAWMHFLLHSSPESKQILLDYLRDLRTDPHPPGLAVRLDRELPEFKQQFLSYLQTLHTSATRISSL